MSAHEDDNEKNIQPKQSEIKLPSIKFLSEGSEGGGLLPSASNLFNTRNNDFGVTQIKDEKPEHMSDSSTHSEARASQEKATEMKEPANAQSENNREPESGITDVRASHQLHEHPLPQRHLRHFHQHQSPDLSHELLKMKNMKPGSGPPHVHHGNHIHVLPLSDSSTHNSANVNQHNKNQVQLVDSPQEKEEDFKKDGTGNTNSASQKQNTRNEEENIQSSQRKKLNTEPLEELQYGARINKTEIEQLIEEHFPSHSNLGTIVYNPTTTWSTIQLSTLPGIKEDHRRYLNEMKKRYEDKLKEDYFYSRRKYIPMIPPLPSCYINSLLEIKIPYRFIRSFKRQLEAGNISERREVWGGIGGVYTDDSEILSVLTHLGFFVNKINLTEWNKNWSASDVSYPHYEKIDNYKMVGDLSAIIILLPTLTQYMGFYAHGINSRSWVGYEKHDGLSYAIYTYKWENCDAYLQDKHFFKASQAEIAEESHVSKKHLSTKEGWNFNYEHLKLIKLNFNELDKNSAI